MTHRAEVRGIAGHVPVEPDRSVLECLLRAGVWVPHSCTYGECGTCKARVVEGEVTELRPISDFVLLDFERMDGTTLLCSVAARSDLVIEADDAATDPSAQPISDVTATIRSLERIDDVIVVRLDLAAPLQYRPGQYMRLSVPGTNVERAYSMATPVDPDLLVELHIKLVPGGVASDYFEHRARVGTLLHATAPWGSFVPRPHEQVVFVAGGTGLAPVKAMLLAELASQREHPVTLLWAVRRATQLYDAATIAELCAIHPRLSFVAVVDEELPPGDTSAELIAGHLRSLVGATTYAAGPPGFLDALRATLELHDVDLSSFHTEEFAAATSPGSAAPAAVPSW